MTDEMTRQPFARAVLATPARNRGGDDPLGSLARTVLSGEATLQTAAQFSWLGQGLDDAFTASLAQRDALTAAERAEWERQAQQLRDAGAALTVGMDTSGADIRGGEGRQ